MRTGCVLSPSARPTEVRRGFTLIELLVVVAIIALLIAILLPSLGAAKRISMQTRCGTNLAGIGRAVQAYQSEYAQAPISQRAFYRTSGWATNQLVQIRTDLSGKWSINSMLAPYAGHGISKILVCPALTSDPLPLMPLGTPSSSTTWWDYNNDKVSSSAPTIWGYGTYLWFVGDQGNGTANGSNPGGTNPWHSSVDYTNTDGTPYNGINCPPNLLAVAPSTLLVQDLLQKDSTSGSYQGNHPYSGGNLMPQVSAPQAGNGRYYLYSAYYAGSKVTDYAGANVLLANWSVEWRKPSDLRQVIGGGTSAPQTMYLGSPAY